MEEKKIKIVLIGNGFDLAHDLKTRYADFLNYLEEEVTKSSTFCEQYPRYKHWNKEGKEDEWIALRADQDGNLKLSVNPHKQRKSAYFQELFDSRINPELMNWADLETFYFERLLKEMEDKNRINTLNMEFEYMKDLLEDYLKSQVEALEFDKLEIDNNPIMRLLNNDQDYDEIFFVTFNYTSRILDYYYNRLGMVTMTGERHNKRFSLKPIHIHGQLNEVNNPIIFGYGDENSADYQELEDALNDDLLVNFKTFQYLRTENYKAVLALLESSDDIDVQIIGHSCGLCDKALLRKIFQHENVKRIEAVYHGDETNYFSKLYSISRIFDDNTEMRGKVISLEKTRSI